MIAKLLVAGLLVGHAAIHASFLSPTPPATASGPAWPFDLARSVLLTPLGADAAALRLLGAALIAVVLGGFGLAALAVLGVVPGSVLEPATIIGALASLALLAIYFNPWFLLGIGIDIVLLRVAAGGWTPESIGA